MQTEIITHKICKFIYNVHDVSYGNFRTLSIILGMILSSKYCICISDFGYWRSKWLVLSVVKSQLG